MSFNGILPNMSLVLIIDLLSVGVLCAVVLTRGFEASLPLAAFLMILFPNESQIHLPGLFDLTTQRALVMALFVLYLFLGSARNNPGEQNHLPLKYLVLLQVVWMLLSSAHSVVFDVSFKTVLSQLFDFYLPYYIFAKSITRVKTVQQILFAFVLVVFICSIFGVFEVYRGWSVLSIFPPGSHRFGGGADTELDRGVRVQATFGHPILFGSALAMAIPLALYLLTLARTSGQKILGWIAVMLMFLNIYKTGSRGPWLALVLSMGILLVFSRNQVRKYLIVITLVASIVLIARPGVWESISNMYTATQDPNSPQGESYEWRYALYRIAGQKLGDNFGRALLGFGPESFYYLGWRGEFHGRIVPFDSCDSSIAAVMIETGYVGLLIVAFLLLKAAVVAFKNFRKIPKPSNYLCLVLFTNICAFCFMMTNVAIFGWGQQTYMLWIIIALSMIYPHLLETQSLNQEESELGPIPWNRQLAGTPR
jgi:hypothetical protein